MEKPCICCGVTKPIAEFYAHKMMADGHLNKCKDCVKAAVKARRQDPATRGHVLAYDRARGNRQDRDYMKRYREAFLNKYRAHTMVSKAVRDGRLAQEPCSVCGASEYVHAHHDDYAKPLNVRWLCAAHHRQWHAEHGEAANP